MENQILQKRNQDDFNEEVDLRELIQVLIRGKRVIFAVVLVAAIAALAINAILPKVYEVKTALEIGTIVTVDAQEALENSIQLQGKIDNDVYGYIARRELQISEYDYPKIKVNNLKDTNTIFISTQSPKIEDTKKIFSRINALILADHGQKLEIAKKEFKSRIEIEEKNIERLRNKIQSLEQEKTAIEGKIAVLQGLSIANRDVGTQFALFDNKEQLENKIQEIESTYQIINSDYVLINSLQRQIDQSKATVVIQEPSISEEPVSPRPLLYTGLAAMLGFFIGIFWVLISEWWNKGRIKANKTQ